MGLPARMKNISDFVPPPPETQKAPLTRTLLVVGLSPASFKDEVLKHLWPKKYQPKLRLVWLNRDDPPPSLPPPWGWHETHRKPVESLLAPENVSEAGREEGIAQAWGDSIFVVMGAGCSVQDFRHLKVAWANAYPFDKELLQVREGGREGGRAGERRRMGKV